MLASLIAAFASGEATLALQRARRAAIAYALAAVLIGCGSVFLLLAAYIWAATRYGAVPAALGFGVVFIVVALLVLAVHSLSGRRTVRVAAERRSSDMKAIGVAVGAAALPAVLSGRLGRAALIAPAIGALAYFIYRENRGRPPRLP